MTYLSILTSCCAIFTPDRLVIQSVCSLFMNIHSRKFNRDGFRCSLVENIHASKAKDCTTLIKLTMFPLNYENVLNFT